MTQINRIAMLSVALLLGGAYAQTGPAGVGTSATNIVWLDAHEMMLSDGGAVSSFTDYSGNGNNFTQSTSDLRPTYSENSIGQAHALLFDGSNDVMTGGSIAALVSAGVTYFIAFDRDVLNSQMIIDARYDGSPKFRTYCNDGNNSVLGAHYSPSIKYALYTDPGAGTFISSHCTPTSVSIYNEGNLMQSKSQGYTTPTSMDQIAIGNSIQLGPNNYALNGLIGEVIIFNTDVNALERVLIENYLGAKFGVSPATDLYDHQDDHYIELIGIGNDGTFSQTSARGKGVLQFSAPTDLGSNEFLLAAHTDVPISVMSANTPTAGNERFERTWRVDETGGDVGTVTIQFHLSGSEDFANSASYRLLVDTDDNFSDATEIAGSYAAGTVTFTHNFSNNEFFTLSGNPEVLDIISIVDGQNWNDVSTWDCTCIPGPNDNVTIDSDHTVTVAADGNASNLTINPDGTLQMNAVAELTLFGDMTISGALDITDGTIAFEGSADQTVDGDGGSHTFNNIIVDLAGELQFTNATIFLLDGLLSPNGGTMDVTAGANFVVNSTSATTGGAIGELIDPFEFTGTYTVRRFIPGGVAGWRNLASPVIGATLSEWDDNIEISGTGFPDGCAYGGGDCFYSVKKWQGNLSYDQTSMSNPLTNGHGFEVFVGTDLTTWAGGTLDVRGTLNGGSAVTINPPTGWMTIGNPYASPVLFSESTRSSQIGNYFYVFDPVAGEYQWYNGAGGGSSSVAELTDGLMASGQAVWISASSLGSIIWEQSDKTTNTATYIRSSKTDGKTMMVNLNENASTFTANIAFEQNELATDGYDSLIDMKSLPFDIMMGGDQPNERAPILEIIDEELLRKNHIANDGKDKAFELSTNFFNSGYYTFSIYNFAEFGDYQKILIVDKETGESVNLKEENYVFHTDEGESNRFKMIFTNTASSADGGITIEEEDELTIIQSGHFIDVQAEIDNTKNVEISIMNILGQQTVYTVNTQLVNGSNIVQLPENLKGLHIISITDSEKTVTKKVVL